MKTLLKLCLALMVMAGSLDTASAQNAKQQKRADEVKALVNGVNYVFIANYVNPQRGGGRSLTSDYDLRVTKDTITSYLPYFGRAYVAPSNPFSSDSNGIMFKSTNFDYTVKEGKKGNWDIYIKPKGGNISDMKDVQQLRLSVSTNGFANLFVTSTNREPISFNGEIEAVKK